MQRRKFIAAVGSTAAVGLAGCSGGEGSSGNGNGGGCSAPEDLEGALPEGDNYEMLSEPTTTDEDQFSSTGATYEGPEGDSFTMTINRYDNSDLATVNDIDTADEDQVQGSFAVDSNVYTFWGPDKESAKEFAATSSALESGCIDSNVEWVVE